MGADLYIQSLHAAQRARWERRYEAAAKLRDRLPAGSTEAKGAQAEVERSFEQMYARGYFRDPYNNRDVLWQFGLSWWTDIIPMLDGDSALSVSASRRLLLILKERETAFEERLSAFLEKDQRYFRDRYAELQRFLNEAITLDEPITCSL